MEDDKNSDKETTRYTYVEDSLRAIQGDIERFLKNFEAKNSYKWSDFADVYNEMDFTNIFA